MTAPTSVTPDSIINRYGPPPSPTIVTFNPDYDAWIERAALMLCDHPEQERVCRPCFDHLHEARDIAASVRSHE